MSFKYSLKLHNVFVPVTSESLVVTLVSLPRPVSCFSSGEQHVTRFLLYLFVKSYLCLSFYDAVSCLADLLWSLKRLFDLTPVIIFVSYFAKHGVDYYVGVSSLGRESVLTDRSESETSITVSLFIYRTTLALSDLGIKAFSFLAEIVDFLDELLDDFLANLCIANVYLLWMFYYWIIAMRSLADDVAFAHWLRAVRCFVRFACFGSCASSVDVSLLKLSGDSLFCDGLSLSVEWGS